MLRRLNALCFCLGLVGLLAVQTSQSVFAKSDDITIPAESRATFMLRPELPKDNLGGKQLGYFNLQLKSGQQRTVFLEVFNPTAKAMTIYGQVKDATTNDNATIDYLGTNPIDQRLLKQPGSQIITVPRATKLQPNETKRLKVTIQAPNKAFKGQKATAINLSTNQLANKDAVENHYVYAIALILNGQKLAAREQKPIQSAKIKTRLTKQRRAAISVAITNPNPAYLKAATIKVDLQNQRWSLIRYQDKKINRKIAPNSQFYEDVLLGGKRLVSGVYRMTLTVKTKNQQQVIHKYVAISKGQARYINQNNNQYLKYRNLIILGSIVIILIGIVAGNLSRREKHKKRDGNDERE
ncbi:DUF916 domain-containing protein [Latilactobacillus curvatus]|uniref:DUF916 domain-containing protein n=1 Tax=Latilactobacillus curvatus TaxID=28038 RepID=UPI000FECD537|nr:DUF916 domain-containing protein [Latilactobacillus curvatus]MDT3393782.1 DUF916 and DUF3324 domain-containing protein [Bacillota bacterium]QAR36221.1 DUF916 domain-containing protein [Latilactobacillus curvatus]